MASIVLAHHVSDEGAIGSEAIETVGSAQKKCLGDTLFDVAMASLDGAVLVGNAMVVAARHHAEMADERLETLCQMNAAERLSLRCSLYFLSRADGYTTLTLAMRDGGVSEIRRFPHTSYRIRTDTRIEAEPARKSQDADGKHQDGDQCAAYMQQEHHAHGAFSHNGARWRPRLGRA
jgi:hypothetical protein